MVLNSRFSGPNDKQYIKQLEHEVKWYFFHFSGSIFPLIWFDNYWISIAVCIVNLCANWSGLRAFESPNRHFTEWTVSTSTLIRQRMKNASKQVERGTATTPHFCVPWSWPRQCQSSTSTDLRGSESAASGKNLEPDLLLLFATRSSRSISFKAEELWWLCSLKGNLYGSHSFFVDVEFLFVVTKVLYCRKENSSNNKTAILMWKIWTWIDETSK